MIRYDLGQGTTYKVRSGTWLTPWVKHAAEAYNFLLNTPERRNRWYTWAEFADFMKGYSSSVTVHTIAVHVEAEGKAQNV